MLGMSVTPRMPGMTTLRMLQAWLWPHNVRRWQLQHAPGTTATTHTSGMLRLHVHQQNCDYMHIGHNTTNLAQLSLTPAHCMVLCSDGMFLSCHFLFIFTLLTASSHLHMPITVWRASFSHHNGLSSTTVVVCKVARNRLSLGFDSLRMLSFDGAQWPDYAAVWRCPDVLQLESQTGFQPLFIWDPMELPQLARYIWECSAVRNTGEVLDSECSSRSHCMLRTAEQMV